MGMRLEEGCKLLKIRRVLRLALSVLFLATTTFAVAER